MYIEPVNLSTLTLSNCDVCSRKCEMKTFYNTHDFVGGRTSRMLSISDGVGIRISSVVANQTVGEGRGNVSKMPIKGGGVEKNMGAFKFNSNFAYF